MIQVRTSGGDETTFTTQIYFKDIIPIEFEDYVSKRATQFASVSKIHPGSGSGHLKNGGRLVQFTVKLNIWSNNDDVKLIVTTRKVTHNNNSTHYIRNFTKIQDDIFDISIEFLAPMFLLWQCWLGLGPAFPGSFLSEVFVLLQHHIPASPLIVDPQLRLCFNEHLRVGGVALYANKINI